MWGDTTKTRSPIHKDSENFAYTCIIGRSSKQENYFQILIRSQHKVIYMTIMKHNPNYLRSKCVSISTIFLFYQYFIMFLNRTVICVLPFKNHNQDRYLFSNVNTNVQSTDPNWYRPKLPSACSISSCERNLNPFENKLHLLASAVSALLNRKRLSWWRTRKSSWKCWQWLEQKKTMHNIALNWLFYKCGLKKYTSKLAQ